MSNTNQPNFSTGWDTTNDSNYTTYYWDFNGPTVKTVPDIVFTKEDTLKTIKDSLNAVYGTDCSMALDAIKTTLDASHITTGKICGARMPRINKVIFNPPATVVMWEDGTKTIVKCTEGEEFKEELGLAMAIAKRYFGNRSKFKKEVARASRPQEKMLDNEEDYDGWLPKLIKKTFPISKGADDE